VPSGGIDDVELAIEIVGTNLGGDLIVVRDNSLEEYRWIGVD
jgi:hypothetical protein